VPKDPFCDKSIRSEVFLETKHFAAIPDTWPVLPGHSLVIPKRHVTSILELSSEELIDLGVMLNRLIPKLIKAYDADSYNLSINAGASAGMIIGHMHIHVVPRRRGDYLQKAGIRAFYTELGKEGKERAVKFDADLERLRNIFRYEPKEREE